MFLKIYPENPNPREIQKVVDCLQNGGIIIYPTDTIYGIGCDIFKPKAIEKITELVGNKHKKSAMTFICYDLSHLSDFTKPISNSIFKVMKRALPGPYTFILEANSHVPKLVQSNKKTIGIRVPNNSIAREIVRVLGHPILSTSVKDDDEVVEYTTDPELIYEKYVDKVDMVVDGGYGDNIPSTVVNCVGDDIEVLRQGKGDIELLY